MTPARFIRLPKILLFFFLSAVLLISCKKNKTDVMEPSVPAGTAYTIDGIITGPNGIPLSNVSVKAGSVTVMTDINGHFHATEAQFATSERFVTATLSGYFTGSRTFFASAGSNNFIKIQLMPRVEAGTIVAASGGTVAIGPASVSFPANAFGTADGSVYTGTVSVKGVYLDPSSPSIQQQMPGDLRGLNAAGALRGLRTFGMLNVEFEGNSGQALQLVNGATAQLSMPIPASLAAHAPSSMPLWFFDLETGLWKEEGVANKSGTNYTGTVSHFTFWNVDDPFEYVKLKMRVINQASAPLQSIEVHLTSLADSASSYDYTDQEGRVDGYVPVNVAMRRDIYNECSELVSSTVIGPFSADTDLGDVQLTINAPQQTISGTVTDCSNLPLPSGYVIITTAGHSIYTPVSNGNFSIGYTNCSAAGSATIIAVDATGAQQSAAVTISLSAAVVNAGNLQACGTSSDEYIIIAVDGISHTWLPQVPYDLFGEEDPFASSGFHDFYVSAYDTSSTGVGTLDISFLRSVDSTAAPFLASISGMSIHDPVVGSNMFGDYFLDNSVFEIPKAHIVTYEAVGGFMEGNFSGDFIKSVGPIVDTVNVQCSFRVRRQ